MIVARFSGAFLFFVLRPEEKIDERLLLGSGVVLMAGWDPVDQRFHPWSISCSRYLMLSERICLLLQLCLCRASW